MDRDMTDTGQPSAEQWACRSCSWVSDPAAGFYDGEAGVEYEPYTPREALPDAIAVRLWIVEGELPHARAGRGGAGMPRLRRRAPGIA
jgi:rubredoxin